MPFNLFHRKKPEQEVPATAPQPEEPAQPTQEAPPEQAITAEEPTLQHMPTAEALPQEAPAPVEEQPQQLPASAVEQKPEASAEPASKTYLKAMPLKELAEVENVKNEVRNGNIIILRITPLAGKSIEDVKTAVNELYQFAESIGGDIARLGEERVVVCPKTVRIWREKTPAPVSGNQPLPTAA